VNELQKLVFIGVGPFPEIVDIALDINKIRPTYEVLGVLDDNTVLHNKIIAGFKVLGPLSLAGQFSPEVKFVMGIGSHTSRLSRYNIINSLGLAPERYETLIAPSAKIFSTATIGHGCIIDPGVVIACNVVMHNFCVIKANSIIGASNLVGEGVLFTGLSITTANVKLGSYSFTGVNSSIAEGREIGPGALVSMSTFVTRNIKPGRTAFGNPCQIVDQVDVNPQILADWERLKKSYTEKVTNQGTQK